MKKSFYTILVVGIGWVFVSTSCKKENLQTAKDSNGQGSYATKGSASTENADPTLGVSYTPPADPNAPRTCPASHK